VLTGNGLAKVFQHYLQTELHTRKKNVRKVVYVPVKQVEIPNNNPFHCDPRVVNVEAKVPELLNLQQLIVNKRGQPKIK
jgi:hypothetical protein